MKNVRSHWRGSAEGSLRENADVDELGLSQIVKQFHDLF